MANKYYTLTRTADRDLTELTSWSLARWGDALTDNYLDDLHSGIEWIAKNQNKVGTRSNLTADTGLSIYPIREHYVIFLPVAKEHVIVAAFLKQGRDIPHILSKNSVRLGNELRQITNKIERGEIVIPVDKKR